MCPCRAVAGRIDKVGCCSCAEQSEMINGQVGLDLGISCDLFLK